MKTKLKLFSRSRELESEIEEFLTNISESALLYKMALVIYLRDGANSGFEEKLKHLCDIETRNDTLRRKIETKLYQQTLIPDSRGDVLGLLENLDQVLGQLEGGLFAFSIEQPVLPDNLKELYEELMIYVLDSVEHLVLASRAFFRNPEAVFDSLHKVSFYEKEADKVSTALKREIFRLDTDIGLKMHLKSFVEYIDDVANGAEDVADRLSIYAIKRAL